MRRAAPVAVVPPTTSVFSRILAVPISPFAFFRKLDFPAQIGAIVLAISAVVAVAPSLVAPYHPLAFGYDSVLEEPSLAHPLGTDNFGRDVLSRIMHGAQTSLYVGFGAIFLATLIGTTVALISAYFGGWVDLTVQRGVDVMAAFPGLLMALLLAALLGPSRETVIVAIATVEIAVFTRVIRSSALAVRQTAYVDAAVTMGAGHFRIMGWHILPNVASEILVLATAQLALAIVIEASLSFLGFGVPPPAPSWGRMLNEGANQYLRIAPWLAIFPGLAITLVAFSFNFLGDGIREVLDPRSRGRVSHENH